MKFFKSKIIFLAGLIWLNFKNLGITLWLGFDKHPVIFFLVIIGLIVSFLTALFVLLERKEDSIPTTIRILLVVSFLFVAIATSVLW